MTELIPLVSHKLRQYWPTEDWQKKESKVNFNDFLGYDADRLHNIGKTYSCLVVKSGYIVGEFYGYELPSFTKAKIVDKTTKLLSWSVAKSILHAVVGLAIRDSIVDIDEDNLFPEWDNDDRKNIRLRDLLEMRDGLDFVEDYTDERKSDVIDMLFRDGADDVSKFAIEKELIHEPSVHFNYSSGSSNILSRLILERLGGTEKFEKFVRSNLFNKIGMNSVELKYDKKGVWIASSFVYATARDYAKFGYLYLNGGNWNGEQILPLKWIDNSRAKLSIDQETKWNYGSLWWVKDDRFGTFWADGFEGQLVVVSPKLDVVLVRFGKTDSNLRENLSKWLEGILEVLDD
jgi:CubicO group peptidase (beta-lactamase class C family)